MDEEKEKQLEWYKKKYPYIEKRGLSNWKNLFRKPTLEEWTILFMLIMGLFVAWAYMKDIQTCREFLNNLTNIACEICHQTIYSNATKIPQINWTLFNQSIVR